jgi:O-antigen ligase
MAIFLMRHYRRMSFRMIMALSAAVLFATLAFLSLSGEKWRGILAEDNRSSWASRQMIWHSAARMIADSPLTGIGPGNFQGQYLAYQRYFPPYLEWSVPHPHNMFLDIWLEGGILGVCGFVGLFFSGGVRSLRNFLDKKNEGRISPSLTFLILVYFLCIGLF